jgi:hypothetical protein
MILPQLPGTPLSIQLSFHKIIERYEEIAASGDGLYSAKAKQILHEVAAHPELKDGISSISQLEENTTIISHLLADLFPAALTQNEIKAVSLPYQGIMFNYTERFRNILEEAGPDFEINIRGFDDDQLFIATCCLILNRFYGTTLDFSQPLFYDIPTASGVIKHYRIMYNADFIEIIATEKAPVLSGADINLLLDNYDNIGLWKATFPAQSYELKGFAIMTLFDVTTENAVSILKDSLITNKVAPAIQQSLELIFRSIFKIPDLRVGFALFDKGEEKFSNAIFGSQVHSFLLMDKDEDDSERLLCSGSYESLMKDHAYFAVSNINTFIAGSKDASMAKHFSLQDVESFILAPVVKDGILLGILELVSSRPTELNSINAHKLDIVMPYLVDTIDRKVNEFQTKIQAVIQNNYTTLHPSVNWKFIREAKNYIRSFYTGQPYTLKQIVFKNVYPLYGQVDIGNSSITRNQSVRNDLLNQLNQLVAIIEQLHAYKYTEVAEQNLTELKVFVDDLSAGIKADTEQYIQEYLENNIYPLLKDSYNEAITASIENYFNQVDALTGEFHLNRRYYEQTLTSINGILTAVLDRRQDEIQKYYPHYYERFKTDGVEHNLYIGATIAPTLTYSDQHWRRLRLWQLLVTAEMEMEQYHLRPTLPYPLGVTSLILVFSTPIAIRFRMDEKHFDIDGAYNVRYEVIKKRIDKAHIKNTGERVTQEGKLTIVYSKSEEETEYSYYLHIMRSAGILADDTEYFDIEDLQGVSGLKGLRVGILHEQNVFKKNTLSYDVLYTQLN